MEHARALLQDALEVLNAAAAVTNSSLKEVLTNAALSAAEQAAAELRRHLQPNPAAPLSPHFPLLDLTPIEPSEEDDESVELRIVDADHPAESHSLPHRPYESFVAAMVPVLRQAYPDDRQQTRITRIGQLWQRHKTAPSILAAIAAASKEVREASGAA